MNSLCLDYGTIEGRNENTEVDNESLNNNTSRETKEKLYTDTKDSLLLRIVSPINSLYLLILAT